MRHLFLYIALFLGLIGCNESSNDDSGIAYLGGEIINPKSDIVIVYNRDLNISDTLKLDRNNRFIHKIEGVTPSVYSFFHGGENQLVIIEPSDSILFRLNTYDFDESLVFTGEGARKNNYLIKTFLENEENSKKLIKYAQKDPEDFLPLMEEQHESAINEFNGFSEKKPLSSFASHVIKSSIDYHTYANKEIYPFAYFGNNKLVHVMDLPENFYDYRKDIDYNDKDLNELYAYNRFLFSHFDNLALTNYYKDKPYHTPFDRHELSYNLSKIDLVDSLITEPKIKNHVLKYKVRDFMNNASDDEQINVMMDYFVKRSSSDEDKLYIRKQVESIRKLRPGQTIPAIEIVNVKNEKFPISEIVNRPTLMYFWSTNNIQHYRNSHYRVRELREQFPEMAFISINTNDNLDAYWKEILDKYKFSVDDEYRFVNPKQALKTLAVNYVYKVIIVDKNANIVHPNVNIFSDDFEILLEELKLKKELSL